MTGGMSNVKGSRAEGLTPQRFTILGCLIPTMFEDGGRIEFERGKRGGLIGATIYPGGKPVSRAVLVGMQGDGLLDAEGKPTEAAYHLYLQKHNDRRAA